MGFVSYAQNNEDVLLHRVFGGQEMGFYVDIGAYHPVDGSVTKALYDRGWSGINIEPGAVFDDLEAARPRDVNLRMAVLDRSGTVSFAEDKLDRGMSRVSDDDSGSLPTVACDTLENIVRIHGRGRPIDFIKIDAEGAERLIVQSTDWRKLRPRVLVIEATLPWSNVLNNQDWEPVLLENDYIRSYFDGINCFYVPQEEAHSLLRHFSSPVGVLDAASRYEYVQLAADRDRLNGELFALNGELESLRSRAQAFADRDSQLTGAQTQISALGADIERLRGALGQAVKEREELSEELSSVRSEFEAQESCAKALAERDQELSDARTQISVLETDIAQLRDAASVAVAQVSDQMAPGSTGGSAPIQAIPMRNQTAPGDVKLGFLRRVSRSLYGIVRPIVRPIMWRTRSFMLSDIVTRLDELGRRVDTLASKESSQIYHTGAIDSPLTELRQLATAVEAALLTLAMEAATASRVGAIDVISTRHEGEDVSDGGKPMRSGNAKVAPRG